MSFEAHYAANKERYVDRKDCPVILYNLNGEIKELFGFPDEDEMIFLSRARRVVPAVEESPKIFLDRIRETPPRNRSKVKKLHTKE